MTAFKKAMVALDLSEMDKQLIAYTKQMVEIYGIQLVYFVHIMPNFLSPKNIDARFHQSFAPDYPIDEKIKYKLLEEIEAVFVGEEDLNLQVEIIEGKIYQKLLHWAELKAIDLLIVGKKSNSRGSGITPKRMAQKIKSAVLFATENPQKDIRHIGVPMDFSDYSLRALQTALQVRKTFPTAKISCINVLDLPALLYSENSIKYKQLGDSIKSNTEETHRLFLEKNKIKKENMEFVILHDSHHSIAQNIRDYTDTHPMDLLIMGAKGHSFFEDFLYGSVTEKIVTYEKKVPVLLVR